MLHCCSYSFFLVGNRRMHDCLVNHTYYGGRWSKNRPSDHEVKVQSSTKTLQPRTLIYYVCTGIYLFYLLTYNGILCTTIQNTRFIKTWMNESKEKTNLITSAPFLKKNVCDNSPLLWLSHACWTFSKSIKIAFMDLIYKNLANSFTFTIKIKIILGSELHVCFSSACNLKEETLKGTIIYRVIEEN